MKYMNTKTNYEWNDIIITRCRGNMYDEVFVVAIAIDVLL